MVFYSCYHKIFYTRCIETACYSTEKGSYQHFNFLNLWHKLTHEPTTLSEVTKYRLSHPSVTSPWQLCLMKHQPFCPNCSSQHTPHYHSFCQKLKLYIMPIQRIISTVTMIWFMILFSFKIHNKRASGASCRISAKQALGISSVCLIELQKEKVGVYRSYSRFDLLLQGLE